jgi:hypothetical protein
MSDRCHGSGSCTDHAGRPRSGAGCGTHERRPARLDRPAREPPGSEVEIQAKQEAETRKVQLVHEAALTIRQLLDEAEKAYGRSAWEEDDCQSRMHDLVFEE